MTSMNSTMKFRSVKCTKWAFLTLAFIMLFLVKSSHAAIPVPPNPPRLVVDFTATLSQSQIDRLENKLVGYNDSTSTQILVVLVDDLAGMEVSQMAYEIGEKWGVGQKGLNNGIVVLIKPKTEKSRGRAFIASGYGVESVVTDALAKRIVENDMIPSFRENDYFGGIDKATDTLFAILTGTYEASDEVQAGDYLAGIIPLIIVIVILVIALNSGNSNKHMRSNKLSGPSLWTLLWLASQAGRSHGGSWGSFSGGSGGFGGGGGFKGGGGFGGFGGGSFGGGGAGGSW